MVGRRVAGWLRRTIRLHGLADLPRDLYYGIYAVVAIGFFVLWSRSTQQSLAAMVRRRWVLADVLGLAVAVLMGLIVLRTEPAMSGSTGARLVWDVLWRGVVYGAVDGLFLSSFPKWPAVLGRLGRPTRLNDGSDLVPIDQLRDGRPAVPNQPRGRADRGGARAPTVDQGDLPQWKSETVAMVAVGSWDREGSQLCLMLEPVDHEAQCCSARKADCSRRH